MSAQGGLSKYNLVNQSTWTVGNTGIIVKLLYNRFAEDSTPKHQPTGLSSNYSSYKDIVNSIWC
jgi:hypothetical protein